MNMMPLNSEITDDQLTLGELEAFSSLRVGQATYVKDDVLNGNAPDSDGKGHGVMTAIGTLQESGEFFYVHWHEEFLPEIGKNVLLDITIRFFPNLRFSEGPCAAGVAFLKQPLSHINLRRIQLHR